MSNVLPLILALISQHPDVVAGLLSFVVLGAINGLLPTKVNGSVVTRVVSVLVDHLSTSPAAIASHTRRYSPLSAMPR
jgi:branched-subunit amino acid transport protein